MPNLPDLRIDYSKGALREQDAAADPFAQFTAWFAQAADKASGIVEPNAMTLATVDPDGQPTARVVLLKGFDERGFVFFTNYDSAKAAALNHEPRCALCFYWDKLERSVRVTGVAARVADDESDAYFATRPYRSQLGAWVSTQSSVVPARAVLEERFAQLALQYPEGSVVPRPPFWGGFRVAPQSVEFWQGQRSRLHDRLVYTRAGGGWQLQRLSP